MAAADGRTYQRPAPLSTHVNHGMESDDPAVAAMHLACAATFDPSVYVWCASRAGCPRSGARAAARAATCEFCSPPPPTAPPPGVALPASAAGVRALQRQHAPAAASAAHDAALAATARWCATRDVYRMMPRTPLRGTAVGVCPAARPVLFPLLDRTLAYADSSTPIDDRSYGAEGAVCVFAELLLRPYPSSIPAFVRKLAERRERLWEEGNPLRAGFSKSSARSYNKTNPKNLTLVMSMLEKWEDRIARKAAVSLEEERKYVLRIKVGEGLRPPGRVPLCPDADLWLADVVSVMILRDEPLHHREIKKMAKAMFIELGMKDTSVAGRTPRTHAVRIAERKTSSLTDRNPKDFILFTNEHFEVTIKDNTGAKTYDEEAPFPTLDFPSDHGVVASALRVLMQT
eukprot:jgi/Tetstr1/441992/TSEL_003142.t1